MKSEKYQNIVWDIDPTDSMRIRVFDRITDETILRIFLGEAIEMAGRTPVLRHVEVCERSTWKTWHEDTNYNAALVWKIMTDESK